MLSTTAPLFFYHMVSAWHGMWGTAGFACSTQRVVRPDVAFFTQYQACVAGNPSRVNHAFLAFAHGTVSTAVCVRVCFLFVRPPLPHFLLSCLPACLPVSRIPL